MMDLTAFSDERLSGWLQTFVDKLRRYASDLGVSDTEVEEVERESRAMSGLVAEEKQIERPDVDPQLKREFAQYRDLLREGPARDLQQQYPSVFTETATQAAPGIIPRVGQFVENLMQRSGFGPDIAQKLGLAGLGAGALAAMKDPGQFADWFGRFLPGLREKRTDLGVSAREVESLDKDYRATQHLLSQTNALKSQGASGGTFDKLQSYTEMILTGPSDNLKRAFPAVLGILSAAAPGIIPKLTGLINRLRANPKFADLVGRDLGLSEGLPRPTAVSREVETTKNWVWPLLALLGIGLLAWWLLSQTARRAQLPTARAPQVEVTPPRAPVTPALAALSLHDLKFVPTADGGRLTWNTNRASTSQVQLGRTPKYELGYFPRNVARAEKDLVTNHQLGLAGLPRGTYYATAHSMDAAGREVSSGAYTFTIR
jgi:hypothetical protein